MHNNTGVICICPQSKNCQSVQNSQSRLEFDNNRMPIDWLCSNNNNYCNHSNSKATVRMRVHRRLDHAVARAPSQNNSHRIRLQQSSRQCRIPNPLRRFKSRISERTSTRYINRAGATSRLSLRLSSRNHPHSLKPRNSNASKPRLHSLQRTCLLLLLLRHASQTTAKQAMTHHRIDRLLLLLLRQI